MRDILVISWRLLRNVRYEEVTRKLLSWNLGLSRVLSRVANVCIDSNQILLNDNDQIMDRWSQQYRTIRAVWNSVPSAL